MGKSIDLTGQVFGRLTVIKVVDKNSRGLLWLCSCECGNTTYSRVNVLRMGRKRSCGCIKNEILSKRKTTHGQSRNSHSTHEYKAWCQMKGRCYNSNNKNYKDYGGRGITICDEWINNFEQFLSDVGPRPSNKHSLDRIDVNGNYETSNCRWATRSQQARNTRCRKESATGIKGVFPYTKDRFTASIRVDGKSYRLGIFDTLEEAAEARKQAEDKYWGEQT